MRQVVPFCLNNDPNPPDFLTMAVKKKILSSNCLPGDSEYRAPFAHELRKLEKFKEEFYTENW